MKNVLLKDVTHGQKKVYPYLSYEEHVNIHI